MIGDTWSQVAALAFVDVGAASGHLAEGLHHAVGTGDYNGAGWEDLYVGSKFTGNFLAGLEGDGVLAASALLVFLAVFGTSCD